MSSNDTFNYTCSGQRVRTEDSLGRVSFGKPMGNSLIEEQTILLNGRERVSFRTQEYFTWCQTNQHFEYSPSEGTNLFSFGLYPDAIQPSGACSLGQFESVAVKMKLIPGIDVNGSAKFRGYVLAENILRISSGLAALLFNR